MSRLVALLIVAAGLLAGLPGVAVAEQSEGPTPEQKRIASGERHTCAILATGPVRCWGNNNSGELGYGHDNWIGDNEPAGDGGPVDFGIGRSATALAAGPHHTCALIDDGKVKCWGYAYYGQLGQEEQEPYGDDPGETPGQAAPLDLGPGYTAIAIAAGREAQLRDPQRGQCALLGIEQLRRSRLPRERGRDHG